MIDHRSTLLDAGEGGERMRRDELGHAGGVAFRECCGDVHCAQR